MKLQAYTIFDKAAKAFNTPFFMHNKALAIRAFGDNVNAKDENNISKHPEHFALMHIGEYDDASGKFSPIDPELVATAIELVNPSEESELLKEIQSLKKLLLTDIEAN